MNTPDRMTFTPENTTSKLIYFNKKRGWVHLINAKKGNSEVENGL